ncbi:hypothetical protein C8Q78DRAFT_372129 [Trametes maxima]|nr:hypothetical protein C8Q78DRAFT_372129 [Trametes maxima]
MYILTPVVSPRHYTSIPPQSPATTMSKTAVEVKYADVRNMCFYDYCRPSDRNQDTQYVGRFAEREISRLKQQAVSGNDVPLRLEQAMRHRELAGWDTKGKPCEEGALVFLDPIISPDVSGIDFSAPPQTWKTGPPIELTVKAHSLAAYAYFQKFVATPKELESIAGDAKRFPQRAHADGPAAVPLHNIMSAARHANHAASFQFISPVVLKVGFAFRNLIGTLGVDSNALKHFRSLWRVLERCERNGLEKEAWYRCFTDEHGLPSHIQCSGPTCGTSSKHGHAMTPCDGGCPVSVKPYYCCRACQENDQRRHSMICKPFRSDPSPTLKLDAKARESIIAAFVPVGPVVDFELVEVEDFSDPNDGTIVWAVDMPSPYVPGKMVKWVQRFYPD